MSKEYEPKDPVLEALRDGGNFTAAAREIAAGVVKYDKAKKRAPKGVKGGEAEGLKQLSDQPASNTELGIPFRTAPRSAAEAAARKDAATPEELGLLPKPKPFTNPGLGPELSEEDDETDEADEQREKTAPKKGAETVLVLPVDDGRWRWVAIGAVILLVVVAVFLVGRMTATPGTKTTTGSGAGSVAPTFSVVVPAPTPDVSATSLAPSPSSEPSHAVAVKPSGSASTTSHVKLPATPVTAPPATTVVPPTLSATGPKPPIASPAVSSGRLPYILAPE